MQKSGQPGRDQPGSVMGAECPALHRPGPRPQTPLSWALELEHELSIVMSPQSSKQARDRMLASERAEAVRCFLMCVPRVQAWPRCMAGSAGTVVSFILSLSLSKQNERDRERERDPFNAAGEQVS